ncbi:MAG: hypothetical protein SPI18_06220 [Prevotella sp.]|nr:hypothetical protein [Prevotella sp.]
MKKFISMCLLALISISALAQTEPNRMIVTYKPYAHKGFLIDRVDSILFTSIEGRVAADTKVLKFSKGETGDTLWAEIKRTADCEAFRISCVSKVVADKLTSDEATAKYFEQIGGDMYFQDFTSGQLTGFDFKFNDNADYALITMGYDKYGIACSMSRSDFKTPAKPLVGNPLVTCELVEVNQDNFTVKFTPNADVKGYSFCSFDKGTAQQQFDQWGAFFGYTTFGDMIKGFCQNEYTEEYTNTWTKMQPGKEYEVVVQAWDAADTYAEPQYFYVTTKSFGGEGVAQVEIKIGDFNGDASTGYHQRVIYTPNDQTALHRDILIEKATFEKEGWGEEGTINFLKSDNPGDPYWNQYGVDDVEWKADPSTTYFACSLAKNAKDEWGPLTKVEFTTPDKTPAASRSQSMGKRILRGISEGTAKIPFTKKMNSKASFKLEQK